MDSANINNNNSNSSFRAENIPFQVEEQDESMDHNHHRQSNDPRIDNNNSNDHNMDSGNMSAAIMELGENLNTFSVSSTTNEPESRRTLGNANQQHNNSNNTNNNNNQQQYLSYDRDDSMDSSSDFSNINEQLLLQDDDNEMVAVDPQNIYSRQQHQQQQRDLNSSEIIIVTNVDSSIFTDDLLKSKFESLFSAYDQEVKFRYLKSFRRVRLDFSNSQAAGEARCNLNQYKLGNTEFRCYPAQLIRAGNTSSEDENIGNPMHLKIPKLTKQFLISPPVSPPFGWEPIEEAEPVVNSIQFLSAIANLLPGETHEIHAGNESQPGIFVQTCEDHPQLEPGPRRTCSRPIPKTPSPAMNYRKN